MSSLSELTEDFSNLVKALREYTQSAHDGLEWQAPPEWFVPGLATAEEGEPPPTSTIDLRDPASIAAVFDRAAIHDLMLKILKQEEAEDDAPADALEPENTGPQPSVPRGAAMDLAVIQSQLEFTQALERSYFCATMGYCRAAAHASARHEAHAVDGGVLDRGIETAVANMKKRAAGPQ